MACHREGAHAGHPSPSQPPRPLSGSLLSMMNDGKSGAPLFCGVWSMDDFSVEGPDARRNEEASDKFGQGSMSRTRTGHR